MMTKLRIENRLTENDKNRFYYWSIKNMNKFYFILVQASQMAWYFLTLKEPSKRKTMFPFIKFDINAVIIRE
jgi:hypothetical protein